jgi:hypothetical protein
VTDKRCRRTGKKATLEATMLLSNDYIITFDAPGKDIVEYFCSYEAYKDKEIELLREETKLDRYLEGMTD